MLFEGAAARGYENLGYITPDDPVAALSNPLPVRRAFERLLARCRDASPTVDVEAAALVHQVVAESRHAKMAPQRKDTAILASLREDASLRLTVERHARRLGMSVADLRAVVQRSASCSPKDYITRTRLNNAKTMLAESDAPIARVASEVGYDDPAYFTRLFTRRVGAAPREFRNQRRGLSRAVGGP